MKFQYQVTDSKGLVSNKQQKKCHRIWTIPLIVLLLCVVALIILVCLKPTHTCYFNEEPFSNGELLNSSRKNDSKETVTVSIYYESLCPDSKRFFFNQLGPYYNKIADRVNLEFIPYGNAKTYKSKGIYSFRCQHAQDECKGNLIQSCAIQIFNNPSEILEFIRCAFKEPKQDMSIEECIEDYEIQLKVYSCANGPIGGVLLAGNGKKTKALEPRHSFIPWITFNGQGSKDITANANRNFITTLCGYYTMDIPQWCGGTNTQQKAPVPQQQASLPQQQASGPQQQATSYGKELLPSQQQGAGQKPVVTL